MMFNKRIVLIVSIVIVFVCVSVILWYAGSTLWTRDQDSSSQSKQKLSSIIEGQTVAIDSPEVLSAGLIYLIQGVVHEMTPAFNNSDQSGVAFRLLDAKGVPMAPQFVVYEERTTLVTVNSQGEEKITIKSIENGDPVQVNYYVDLKTGTAVVTKLAALK